MNKTIISVACGAILLGCSLLQATTSQFRSPLTFIERGYTHYFLDPVAETWWYENTGHDRKDTNWEVDVFKGFYGRSASKSFFDVDCNNPCNNPSLNNANECERDSNTRNTASLSQLWFGSDAFRGEQVFAGGMISTTTSLNPNNIALAFARITPRFEYNEYGAYVGLHTERRLGKKGNWCIGARASMPIKVIEIEQNQSCQIEETLDDVVKLTPITEVDGFVDASQVDFAVRLDFLSALSIPTGDDSSTPFVQYDTGTNTPPTMEQTLMAMVIVSGFTPATPGELPAVYTIASDNGCLPKYPFRKDPAAPDITIDVLPANGSSPDGTISFFQSETDYADGVGSDRNAQSRLFVVPRYTTATDNLATNASTVEQNLQTLLEFIADSGGITSAIDIFNGCSLGDTNNRCCGSPCSIDLCRAERITGQGDLDTEIYGGYGDKNWFSNLVFGVKFPTGTPARDARRVFYQTTGNNRHFEVKVRLEGGWRPFNWFAFQLDGSYSHAIRATEKRAAPFQGATVRNIGPQIDCKVSWGYFVGHADFSFFNPHNPELGCSFGYEIFAKQRDHVSLECETTATDCLGNTNQPLDPCILERNTNSMTHKLRAEVFNRWNFCELFAGVSQVLAGRNAMKESEAHIGFVIYF